MTSNDWPKLPADLAKNANLEPEWAKAVGKAIGDLELERRKQPLTEAAKRIEDALATERLRAENYAALDRLYVEDDEALHKKTEEEMMEVAKASIERARDSAKFVQVAATAVAGIYTGVLGLAFSVAENPLPTRGLIPTLFMGLAVALATGYLGFLTEPENAAPLKPSGSPRTNSQLRTDFFVMWVRGIAMNRASLLRASVVSFVLGVSLLPISIIDFTAASDPTGGALASPSVASVAGTSSPTPSPWPTPQMTEPVELAAVLYAAQLEEFREQGTDMALDTKAKSTREEDVLAWILTVVGLAVVIAFWLEWLPPRAKQKRRRASSTRPRPTIK
jgi:hypothetical protein